MTNTNLQLIQYKTIQRSHITQHKMYKMGQEKIDTCSRCKIDTTDNYFHTLGSANRLTPFWNYLTQKLSTILDCRIRLYSQLCLLGETSEINISNKHKNSLPISLTVTKKTILSNWKSKNSININRCSNLLFRTLELSLKKNQTQLKQCQTFYGKMVPLLGLVWVGLYIISR